MSFPSKFVDSETISITSRWYNQAEEFKGKIQIDTGDDAHQWLIEFMTPPLEPIDKFELNGFLNAQKGRGQTFTVSAILPWYNDSSSYTVATTANKGDSVIAFTGTLVGGSYISLSNHDKVYQVQATGTNSVTITPPLVADVPSTTTITNANFVCRLSSDSTTLELDAKAYSTRQIISLVENI